MRFLFWLSLLFIVLPLVELALLLKLADLTNWKVSLLLVIVTGISGSLLIKRQGIATFRRIQTDMQEGRVPANSLLDGVLLLIAGVLLITPGMLSDMLAIILLIPPTRYLIKLRLVRWFRDHVRVHTTVSTGPGRSENDSPQVIDARVVRREASDE